MDFPSIAQTAGAVRTNQMGSIDYPAGGGKGGVDRGNFSLRYTINGIKGEGQDEGVFVSA